MAHQRDQLRRLWRADSDSALLTTSSPSPASAAQSLTSELDLHSYFAVLVRRVWLIAGIVLAITTSVTLYVFRLPNIYEASAVVRMQQSSSSLPGEQGPNPFEAYQYFQTQVELVKDPRLIRRAVFKHGLYLDPRLVGEGGGGWRSAFRRLMGFEKPSRTPSPQGARPLALADDPNVLTPEQAAMIEADVSSIQEGLTASPLDNTTLITVRFRHTSPEFAAMVTTAVTETFISDNVKYETAGTRSTLERVAKQLAEVQTDIRLLERQRIEALSKNNLPLSEGEGSNLTGERVKVLSTQLLAAEDDRKQLEAEREAAKAAPDIWSVPRVAASKPVQEGRAQLRELSKRRTGLLQMYTAEWGQVKKLDAEIKQVQLGVEDAARQALANLDATYEAALARERKLRSAYEGENRAFDEQGRDSVELTNLNQQIETSRQLYGTLFQYQQKLELDSTDRANRVSMVSAAGRPQTPVAPSRWSRIGLAFLISLMVGVGLAIVVEQFDSKLSSVDDVTTYLSLQTLGTIPQHGRKLPTAASRRGTNEDSALRMMEDVLSPAAEAYRNLRTSLLFALHDSRPQIILVTSSRQLEGKTATSVNLSYAFAQTGAEVLIVDCDLRRPRVHKHFALPDGPGLTDYLIGEAKIDDLLFSHSEYPRLWVLTAGGLPTNPSDYLNSAKMRRLLEQMRNRFAYIVIDSPPVLPFADAPLLSTMADATLIVVNSRRTSRRVVRRVKERLLQVGSPVLGVVLNYTDAEEKNSYYYYRKEESL